MTADGAGGAPTLLTFFNKEGKRSKVKRVDHDNQSRASRFGQASVADTCVSGLTMGQQSYAADLMNQQKTRDEERKAECMEDAFEILQKKEKENPNLTKAESQQLFVKIFQELIQERQAHYNEEDRLQDRRFQDAFDALVEERTGQTVKKPASGKSLFGPMSPKSPGRASARSLIADSKRSLASALATSPKSPASSMQSSDQQSPKTPTSKQAHPLDSQPKADPTSPGSIGTADIFAAFTLPPTPELDETKDNSKAKEKQIRRGKKSKPTTKVIRRVKRIPKSTEGSSNGGAQFQMEDIEKPSSHKGQKQKSTSSSTADKAKAEVQSHNSRGEEKPGTSTSSPSKKQRSRSTTKKKKKTKTSSTATESSNEDFMKTAQSSDTLPTVSMSSHGDEEKPPPEAVVRKPASMKKKKSSRRSKDESKEGRRRSKGSSKTKTTKELSSSSKEKRDTRRSTKKSVSASPSTTSSDMIDEVTKILLDKEPSSSTTTVEKSKGRRRKDKSLASSKDDPDKVRDERKRSSLSKTRSSRRNVVEKDIHSKGSTTEKSTRRKSSSKDASATKKKGEKKSSTSTRRGQEKVRPPKKPLTALERMKQDLLLASKRLLDE